MNKGLLFLAVLLMGFTVKGVAHTDEVYNLYDVATQFGVKESSPADGSTVLSLSRLELTFSADAALVEKGTTVSLKNEAGEEVAVGTLKEDTEDYDVINVEFDKTIDTKGTYTVTIPAGAVKEYDGESVSSEVTYTIKVDPDYWDPSWVVELPGGSDYKENPTELTAGRKHNIGSSGTTYVVYKATETGRLYFNTNTTTSTTIRTTEGPANDWYIRKTLSGTKDEETGNYSYWMGVQAGETYYITLYYYGKSRIFDLVFEAGNAYESIAVTETSHKNGDLYSRAIRTELSYQYGAVDFRFNVGVNADVLKAYVVLPSKENAKLDVTDRKKLGSGNLYYAVLLGDTIEGIKKNYDLKVGDKIQVVLENVQDQDFAENKLAENPSVELTLAGIVCNFVYPYEDNAQESVPSEMELTFDGEVVYGSGYVIDLTTKEKTEIPAANFVLGEPTTDRYNITTYQAILTLPEVTLSKTTKKFAVVLEDLKDKDGNVITYGETEGKFTVTYSLTDDRFAIESIEPAKDAEVTSIQTIKFTFADNVNLVAGETAPYLTDYEDFEMEGTLSVDANDPKTVIMTLKEAVTTPGEYYIVLPEGLIYNSLYDASKEDLGLADGAIYNPYTTSVVVIPADFSDVTVTGISPDSYGNTGATVEELPAEIVVTFSEAVKEITAIYGLGAGGATPYAMEETPEGADALTATIDGNKVKIQVPAGVIVANTFGEYQIVLGVVDADGKPVGANPNDPYDAHVVFSYYIQPSLRLMSYTPEGENLEKVENIVLTFSTDVYPQYDPSGMSPWVGGIELKDAEGNAVGGELNYTFSGKTVTITPTTALTEKGTYKLTIPSGMFYESSFVLDDWTTTYLYNKDITLSFFVQMTNQAVANLTNAVADAKAWIATLDANNADQAEVIAMVNPLVEEGEAILADLENNTLEEVQAQADALNEAVSAWKERFEKQAVAEELQALVTEANEVYNSVPEDVRTDESGLLNAIQNAERAIMYANWGTLDDLKTAKEYLQELLVFFKLENNVNGIDNVEAGKEVMEVKYFTLNGVELSEPVEGVIVKKTLYADGTVVVVKMVVKK